VVSTTEFLVFHILWECFTSCHVHDINVSHSLICERRSLLSFVECRFRK
jgi:hypothetical protein